MNMYFDINGLSREARRHARRALRLTDEDRLVDALVTLAETETSSLAARSAGAYLHAHRDVLDALLQAGEISKWEYKTAEASIRAALAARVRPDVPARTSAKKATSLTAAELRVLFYALKTKAMAENAMPVALVALLIIGLVILGARPVELTTLRHAGGFLRIENAKRGRHAGRFRFFRVAALTPGWLRAIVLAADVYRDRADPTGFHAWHCRLAQILATVSQQCLGRRISFYTLRHVTLATWKRAGIPAADIAILAGHIGARAQSHYAGAGSGHAGPVKVVLARPAEVPAGLFSDDPPSPLIAGARSRRAALGGGEAGAELAPAILDSVDLEGHPAARRPAPSASLPGARPPAAPLPASASAPPAAPSPPALAAAPPFSASSEPDRPVPTAPIFELTDMPEPKQPAPPPGPQEFLFPAPEPDAELDALLADLLAAPGGQVDDSGSHDPTWDMPKPYAEAEGDRAPPGGGRVDSPPASAPGGPKPVSPSTRHGRTDCAAETTMPEPGYRDRPGA